MDKRTLAFYRSIQHPFISIFIPFSFLFTFDVLLRARFSSTALPAIPYRFFLIVLAAGIGEAVSANYLVKERINDLTARLRELIIFLAGGYFMAILLNGDLFRGAFNPTPKVLYLLALVLLQWTFSFFFHRWLRDRENYLALVVGKKDIRLREAVSNSRNEARISRIALRQIRGILVCMQIVTLIQFFGLFSFFQRIDAALVLLAFAHAGIGVFCFFLLSDALEEQSMLNQGLVMTGTSQYKSFIARVAMLAPALLLTFLLVGKAPLLRSFPLGAFLQRLLDTLAPEAVDELARAPTTGGAASDTPELGFGNRPAIVATVFLIVCAVGFVVLLFLFLRFILLPFLSKNDIHVFDRMIRALRRFMRYLVDSVTDFASSLLSRLRGLKRIGKLSGRVIDWLSPSAASRDARRSTRRDLPRQVVADRAVRYFLRLIRWGERGGIRFSPTMAPMDYVEQLGRNTPEMESVLVEVGNLFEEIVFAAHDQKAGIISTFIDKVRAIVRTRQQPRSSRPQGLRSWSGDRAAKVLR